MAERAARPASPTACSPPCRASRARLLVRRAGRLRAPAPEDGGTWLGHVLEHVAIELQNLAGAHGRFGKTRGAASPALPRRLPVRGGARRHEAGDLALSCCTPARRPSCGRRAVPEDFDFAAERDELIRFAQRRRSARRTASLVRAAEERDIPWMRLNDHSLVQLGHGKYQKRIQATVTTATRISRSSSRPTRKRRTDPRATRAARAAPGAGAERRGRGEAADRLGYPGRRQAAGREPRPRRLASASRRRRGPRRVRRGARALHVRHRRELPRGLRSPHARRQRRAVAVAQRVPGSRRRRRRAHHRRAGRRSSTRPAARHRPREGAHPDRARPPGRAPAGARRVYARTRCREGEVCSSAPTGNLSTGGTAIDMTDVVHPDNARDGGARREGDRARRRRRRLHQSDISESYARSAAASARSTRRRASACTSRPPRASRATSRAP